MNVRAGLNGNIDGRWLIMLLVITSKYPNTEVMLTRTNRMKKRPPHNHPMEMVANDVSIRVIAASHTPCPVMDMIAGSDVRVVMLIVFIL